MSSSIYTLLLNFLRGVSWAFAIYGGALGFFSFFHISIFSSLLAMFLGSILGLAFVVIFESILEKREHNKRELELLESIDRELKMLNCKEL